MTDTAPDTKQLIEVTQADRDLAIELLALNGHAFSAQLVLEGEGDQWPDVQAIARHRLSALQQPDEPLVGDDGKLTRLPDELVEPYTPDPEAIAKAVQDLKNAMKPDERDEVIARLREERNAVRGELTGAIVTMELARERMVAFKDIGIIRGACPKYGEQELRRAIARARTALRLGGG